MRARSIFSKLIRYGLTDGWASEVDWEDVRPGWTVIVGERRVRFVGLRAGRGGPPQPEVIGLGERDTEERLLRSRHPVAIVVQAHDGQDISLDVPFRPLV